MLKRLIKLFLPNEKKLAVMAAESIAKAINSQTEREAQIAKIATMADKFTAYQKFVTEILTDGKISQEEVDEIAARLEPLMAYVKELI